MHHSSTCTMGHFELKRCKKYWQFQHYDFVMYQLWGFFIFDLPNVLHFYWFFPHYVHSKGVWKRALERVESGWLSMASKMSNYRKISTTVDLTSVYRQVSNNNYTAPLEISTSKNLSLLNSEILQYKLTLACLINWEYSTYSMSWKIRLEYSCRSIEHLVNTQ